MNRWKPLAAARHEVLLIRDLFERRFAGARVTFLRGAKPTEREIREQAPRHRYLHLATHGFFAPPALKSALEGGQAPSRFGLGEWDSSRALTGYHPGLLSGLVLAGANQPRVETDLDDGILTALEVAALDLSGVDMAVLSACETGLGTTAGGEGVLGLQRAFQVAGAKTTVTSLWKVDDAATMVLMEEFYKNLWQKKLSRIEALRQAQLMVLRHPEQILKRRRELNEQLARRGIKVDEAKPLPDGGTIGGRSPPALWAAFVLSGDWR